MLILSKEKAMWEQLLPSTTNRKEVIITSHVLDYEIFKKRFRKPKKFCLIMDFERKNLCKTFNQKVLMNEMFFYFGSNNQYICNQSISSNLDINYTNFFYWYVRYFATVWIFITVSFFHACVCIGMCTPD